jgi:hypothetical protein
MRRSDAEIDSRISPVRNSGSVGEDEVSWLLHRIVRMRTILRFAKDPRIEAGLRELSADAEARLTALEQSDRRLL